ncbi:MAG: ADP-ribosylglycohydrolase family protein [Planctomycetaceae bacterium]|nr:ADP-ribosylglycohydrolase family protein [Planctomycetaceae bacterium]
MDIPSTSQRKEAILGCLLGTAIGDALGLPYEGLSPVRAQKILGPPDRYRFFLRRGMVSDDTEHSCLVAYALLKSQGDPSRFQAILARQLRLWILALPAGVGRATAVSLVKLLVGYPPSQSGVYSAGNGPSMRSAVIGLISEDLEQMKILVSLSSRITHTDPKAEYGALAVALATRLASFETPTSPDIFIRELGHLLGEGSEEFLSLMTSVSESVQADEKTEEFARKLGLSRGVTGYTYHTVPVALHAWLSHDDFQAAIESVIRCGGDTDTVAAITGGIFGSQVERSGLPEHHLNSLKDWPISVSWIEKLGSALAEPQDGQKVQVPFWLFRLIRNLLFLVVVLIHGLRRVLPPYGSEI